MLYFPIEVAILQAFLCLTGKPFNKSGSPSCHTVYNSPSLVLGLVFGHLGSRSLPFVLDAFTFGLKTSSVQTFLILLDLPLTQYFGRCANRVSFLEVFSQL